MKDVTKRHLGEEARPNLMRHLTITFTRHDDEPGIRIHVLTLEEAEEAIQESYSNTVERQANHTLNTSHGIYALETASVF